MNVGLTRALLRRHSDGSEKPLSFERCPPTNPELVFSYMFIAMQKFAPETMIFRFGSQMRLEIRIVELFCEIWGGGKSKKMELVIRFYKNASILTCTQNLSKVVLLFPPLAWTHSTKTTHNLLPPDHHLGLNKNFVLSGL